jgi:hypothetical protein
VVVIFFVAITSTPKTLTQLAAKAYFLAFSAKYPLSIRGEHNQSSKRLYQIICFFLTKTKFASTKGRLYSKSIIILKKSN